MNNNGEGKTAKVQVNQEDEPNLKGDYGNVVLLFFLYCLQGDLNILKQLKTYMLL
jgi:hypothetical protein